MYDNLGASLSVECAFDPFNIISGGIGTTSAGTSSQSGATIIRTKKVPLASGFPGVGWDPFEIWVRSSASASGQSTGSTNRVEGLKRRRTNEPSASPAAT